MDLQKFKAKAIDIIDQENPDLVELKRLIWRYELERIPDNAIVIMKLAAEACGIDYHEMRNKNRKRMVVMARWFFWEWMEEHTPFSGVRCAKMLNQTHDTRIYGLQQLDKLHATDKQMRKIYLRFVRKIMMWESQKSS